MFRRFILLVGLALFFTFVHGQAYMIDGGYFRSLYKQQSSEGKLQMLENPSYGTFKSTSGWKDGKYYLLINDVLPGTVVKIECPKTNKVIYAKVLGTLVQAKENEGLTLRVSNAALDALGLTDAAGLLQLTWNN